MKTEYLISANEINRQKVNQIIKIFGLTNSMEDKLKEQLNNIEKDNLFLQEMMASILNDFKTIAINMHTN